MKVHIPKWHDLKDNRTVRIAVYVALGIMMYLAMLTNVMPEKLNVRLFSIAAKDIISPVTIEDKQATKQNEEAAAAAVPSKYTFKQKESLIQIEKTNAIFDAAVQIVQKANAEQQQSVEKKGSQVSQGTDTNPTTDQPKPKLMFETPGKRIAALKKELSKGAVDGISEETLATLVMADPSTLNMAKEVADTTINNVMSSHIKWGELSKAKDSVPNLMPSSTSLNKDMKNAVIDLAKNAIVPNYVFNPEKTKQARQEAINTVDPVMIQEGQILAKKGQVINHDIYHQLQVVGLLDNQFNPFPFIGLALLVLLLTCFLVYELKRISAKVRTRSTYLFMYALVLFCTLLIMKMISLLEPLGLHGLVFLVPAATGTMLVKMLINERIALVTSIVLALCGSIIFNGDTIGTANFVYGIYILFGCLAGAFSLEKHNARPRIFKTGTFVSLVNIIVVTLFLMLKNGQYTPLDVCLEMGFAFFSGFLSSVLTLGFMPFFEGAFGILSSMRLIELSSPNHPLLRKILTEAPGTYHHSVMVANLAEAACEAIGANGLLARVAAYYHDIGKTKRPRFFIENQMGMENPHEKISPQLSRTVIISHPYDGAAMLKSHRMPKEIIDIAEQHHGTTLLKFFYHKALTNDKTVSDEEFRYPGPKVQTREAAVIEVADSVEAATRSLNKPTPEKIEALVKKIITDRLEDGQFDECHLTLKELDTVAKSICETLKGIFHSRIEYPEMDLKKKVGHG
ncbi:MAG TPA: HD family phosphohydrolase [Bacillales bacterium]|nr:HD family phosphohydrolase [Bacillales bacterium]